MYLLTLDYTKCEKFRKYWLRIYIFFVHTGIYAVHFRVIIYQSGYFSCNYIKNFSFHFERMMMNNFGFLEL